MGQFDRGRANTQSRSAKQVSRRRRRMQDDRVLTAAEQAKRNQARLDRLGGEGPAEGAQYSGMTLAILERFKDSAVEVVTTAFCKAPHPRVAINCDEPDGHAGSHRAGWGPATYAWSREGTEYDEATTRRLVELSARKSRRIEHDAKGDVGWTLKQARQMLRDGYRIDLVIRRTGWGPFWFDDLPIDEDGYGTGKGKVVGLD